MNAAPSVLTARHHAGARPSRPSAFVLAHPCPQPYTQMQCTQVLPPSASAYDHFRSPSPYASSEGGLEDLEEIDVPAANAGSAPARKRKKDRSDDRDEDENAICSPDEGAPRARDGATPSPGAEKLAKEGTDHDEAEDVVFDLKRVRISTKLPGELRLGNDLHEWMEGPQAELHGLHPAESIVEVRRDVVASPLLCSVRFLGVCEFEVSVTRFYPHNAPLIRLVSSSDALRPSDRSALVGRRVLLAQALPFEAMLSSDAHGQTHVRLSDWTSVNTTGQVFSALFQLVVQQLGVFREDVV